MSDEHRKDEEIEVEESADDSEDEIEAHIQKVSNVRMDSPSNT